VKVLAKAVFSPARKLRRGHVGWQESAVYVSFIDLPI